MAGGDHGPFNLSRWALHNQALVIFMVAVLLFAGIWSYGKLGQNEDPPFTFRAMAIRVIWPGASATQVGEQVVDKLEKKLAEVPYIDKVRSYIKPGEAQFILELKESSPPKDVADSWYQVRKKLGDIRGQLPPGVLGPFFNDEFGDVYGSIFALTGDGFSPRDLKEIADKLRLQLLRVPDVGKVEIFGAIDEKLFLEISQRKLAQLGVSVTQIIDAIATQNAVEASGTLITSNESIQIRVPGAFNKPDDLANLLLRVPTVNANAVPSIIVLRLGDIAQIKRGYADPVPSKMRVNGKEGLALGIAMAKGGDVIELGKLIQNKIGEIKKALPLGVELTQIQNQPSEVSKSVNEFVKALIEAVVVVLAVSFLALGVHKRHSTTSMPWLKYRLDMRPGLVVLLTIPLVLAVTFFFMFVFGIGLHKMSLGALIIALGLLVDDAIIAIEMMLRKMEEGMARIEAASFAYRATALPMLTGTLITVAGFMPIGFAKSGAGEYTYAIYAVTGLALIVSWFAAVLAVPLLGEKLLRVAPHANGGHAEVFDTPFYSAFRRLVNWCVTHRWVTILITVIAFGGGIAGMGLVEKQFFPDSTRQEIMVDLWLPEGATAAAAQREAISVETWLKGQKGIESVTTYIGTGAPRFALTLDQILPQNNVAQLVIYAKTLADRDRLKTDLQKLAVEKYAHIRMRTKVLPNGPPVPYPVQFRVTGTDQVAVRQTADAVKKIMRDNPSAVGVNDNWNESVKVLRLVIDEPKARALGVPTQTIARAAQTLLSGTPIGQFREGDKLMDIVLRQPLDERSALSALSEANIPTASGKSVPISQVAAVRLDWEPGVVWRENGSWAITVQTDIKEGLQAATISDQINAKLTDLRAQAPGDVKIIVAGSVEKSEVSNQSIQANFPWMIVLVFILLMIQLRSFSRSLIVFITAPLGIIGAAATLLLLRAPMGFVATLGIIALSGMIMRNSVILIDQIEQDRDAGVAPWDAVVEAAVRRFRPIMLTAAAAILAMIPLTRNVLWGPMAVAIMGGLLVATALTLLFLPAFYAACFRIKRYDLGSQKTSTE